MQGPREGRSARPGAEDSFVSGGLKPEPDAAEADSRAENALVVVLDLTPGAWAGCAAQGEQRLQLAGLFGLLHRFLKMYAFMSAGHRCCVIGTHSSGTCILYEGVLSDDWLPSCFGGDSGQDERAEATLQRIWRHMLDFIGSWSASSRDPQMTTALSMGLLCEWTPYPLDDTPDLNRLKQSNVGYGRRIVLLDASSTNDYRSQYIGLMNVAFAASKSVRARWNPPKRTQNISINTCAFGRSSRILEQLSDITNAKYLSLTKVLQSEGDPDNYEQSVLQLLMFWFLPSEAVSEHLSTQLPFDFSNTAVCYCHYRTVDIAFLCPCCFAVYCSERDDGGKYRVFCFVCNWPRGSDVAREGQHQPLPVPLRLGEVVEEVGVERGLHEPGDPADLADVRGRLEVVAIDPVEQVERADGHALQPDGVGPEDLEGLPAGGDEREEQQRGEERRLVGELVDLAVVGLRDGRRPPDEVDGVRRAEDEEDLHDRVVPADEAEEEVAVPQEEHDQVELVHPAGDAQAVPGQLELEDEHDETRQVAEVAGEPEDVHRHFAAVSSWVCEQGFSAARGRACGGTRAGPGEPRFYSGARRQQHGWQRDRREVAPDVGHVLRVLVVDQVGQVLAHTRVLRPPPALGEQLVYAAVVVRLANAEVGVHGLVDQPVRRRARHSLNAPPVVLADLAVDVAQRHERAELEVRRGAGAKPLEDAGLVVGVVPGAPPLHVAVREVVLAVHSQQQLLDAQSAHGAVEAVAPAPQPRKEPPRPRLTRHHAGVVAAAVAVALLLHRVVRAAAVHLPQQLDEVVPEGGEAVAAVDAMRYLPLPRALVERVAAHAQVKIHANSCRYAIGVENDLCRLQRRVGHARLIGALLRLLVELEVPLPRRDYGSRVLYLLAEGVVPNPPRRPDVVHHFLQVDQAVRAQRHGLARRAERQVLHQDVGPEAHPDAAQRQVGVALADARQPAVQVEQDVAVQCQREAAQPRPGRKRLARHAEVHIQVDMHAGEPQLHGVAYEVPQGREPGRVHVETLAVVGGRARAPLARARLVRLLWLAAAAVHRLVADAVRDADVADNCDNAAEHLLGHILTVRDIGKARRLLHDVVGVRRARACIRQARYLPDDLGVAVAGIVWPIGYLVINAFRRLTRREKVGIRREHDPRPERLSSFLGVGGRRGLTLTRRVTPLVLRSLHVHRGFPLLYRELPAARAECACPPRQVVVQDDYSAVVRLHELAQRHLRLAAEHPREQERLHQPLQQRPAELRARRCQLRARLGGCAEHHAVLPHELAEADEVHPLEAGREHVEGWPVHLADCAESVEVLRQQRPCVVRADQRHAAQLIVEPHPDHCRARGLRQRFSAGRFRGPVEARQPRQQHAQASGVEGQFHPGEHARRGQLGPLHAHHFGRLYHVLCARRRSESQRGGDASVVPEQCVCTVIRAQRSEFCEIPAFLRQYSCSLL
ncbi:RNA polymerase II transcription factor B subunit 4, putative [Babesia caballi]|uniref:RNA polymerase II transcription factor B subunit 4, putative n=1 Tax=Babesia caballi TaxID=5871 RepID=A0AAV4LME4_BABCB|nr:RNA polymerase II transcription factor B subunit 4, putative [Babesia caballi]